MGRALDVGCGTGRNALFLASSGYRVDAVDISPVGIDRAQSTAGARGLDIRFVAADLEAGLPAELGLTREYELIVMVRYVNIPLLRQLATRLAPGGTLLCDQHLRTETDVAGPRNSAFRVGHGELLDAAGTLDIKFYREGIVTDPDGINLSLAQLIAVRGGTSELIYC
jgi:tellurite methyltransferase